MKSDHILFLLCLQGFLLAKKTVIEPSVQVTYAEKITLPAKKASEVSKEKSLPKSHDPAPNRKTLVVTGGEDRDAYISETAGSGTEPYVYSDGLSSATSSTTQQAKAQTSSQPSIMIPAQHPCYTNCMASLNAQSSGNQQTGQSLNLSSTQAQNIPISAAAEDNDAIDNFFGKVNRLVSRTGDITGNILYNTAAVGNNAMNMQYQITANTMNQQAQLEAQNQMNQENLANGVYGNQNTSSNTNQGYYDSSTQMTGNQAYSQYGQATNTYGAQNTYGNSQVATYTPSQTINPTFTGFRVLV